MINRQTRTRTLLHTTTQIATAQPAEVLALTQTLNKCGIRHQGVWQAALLRLAVCQPVPELEELLAVVEGAAKAGTKCERAPWPNCLSFGIPMLRGFTLTTASLF